jgi:hypothetical protein
MYSCVCLPEREKRHTAWFAMYVFPSRKWSFRQNVLIIKFRKYVLMCMPAMSLGVLYLFLNVESNIKKKRKSKHLDGQVQPKFQA